MTTAATTKATQHSPISCAGATPVDAGARQQIGEPAP